MSWIKALTKLCIRIGRLLSRCTDDDRARVVCGLKMFVDMAARLEMDMQKKNEFRDLGSRMLAYGTLIELSTQRAFPLLHTAVYEDTTEFINALKAAAVEDHEMRDLIEMLKAIKYE